MVTMRELKDDGKFIGRVVLIKERLSTGVCPHVEAKAVFIGTVALGTWIFEYFLSSSFF